MDLSQEEIEEMHREEGLVVKPKTAVVAPRRLSDSLSEHLDCDESEQRLMAILEGEGDDEPVVKSPSTPRHTRRTRRDRVSQSVTVGKPLGGGNKAFMRSNTDTNVGKNKYSQNLVEDSSQTGRKSWNMETLKTLDPQEAVAMLEEVSNFDSELAEALIKQLKG